MIHHSIADAYHAFAVVTALWAAYRDAAAGRSLDLPVHTFPEPVEQLLAARGIEKMALPGGPPAGESTAAPPVSQPRDDEYPVLHTTRSRFGRDETAALVELGHRENVTVHGLVSAALLRTEAEIRELPLSGLLYLYSVDLRTRMSPEVDATEGTNVLGFANYLSPEADVTLVDLARGISEALHAGLTAGIVQRTPLSIPDMAAAPSGAPRRGDRDQLGHHPTATGAGRPAHRRLPLHHARETGPDRPTPATTRRRHLRHQHLRGPPERRDPPPTGIRRPPTPPHRSARAPPPFRTRLTARARWLRCGDLLFHAVTRERLRAGAAFVEHACPAARPSARQHDRSRAVDAIGPAHPPTPGTSRSRRRECVGGLPLIDLTNGILRCHY